MARIKHFDSLNTSYVSLAALLRYLRGQDFSGSVRVAVDQYEAEIFLEGTATETVFEFDKASGTSAKNEGALERMLVHARAPGGTITVYEGKTERGSETANESSMASFADEVPPAVAMPAQQIDWDQLFRLSGDVIAAIERAAASVGADFDADFHAACIAVGDDYPFMDPTSSTFKYDSGMVTLRTRPGTSAYVAGLSDCLGRIVSKLALAKEGKQFRERVVVELAEARRQRPSGLAEFEPYLDRIAGSS